MPEAAPEPVEASLPWGFLPALRAEPLSGHRSPSLGGRGAPGPHRASCQGVVLPTRTPERHGGKGATLRLSETMVVILLCLLISENHIPVHSFTE